MKRFFFTALLLSCTFFVNAQNNTLLNGNFWKEKPALSLVQEEINKGNNPAAANGGNHDVVSMAINNDADFETIKFLISQPGNSIDKTTHDGRLYIHWAASKGNVALVKYLISLGSNLTRTDDKGATAVSFAAGNGQTNTEVYELFFNAGINPKAKYKDGANLLHLSIASDSDLKFADYLISKGLSLKDTDDLGRTTFDYAARNGNIELLKNLVKKGVKPTGNALLIATQGSRTQSNTLETYKYLVETAKVKANSVGENGENVLHNLVKKQDQTEIINYFISKKVDVNATDKQGNNAFMVASGSKNLDVLNQLLPKVKNINALNAKGETALYQAVQNGSPEVVSYLIEKGAKTSIVANDGNLAHALVQSYKKPRPNDKSNDFANKLEILSKNGVNFASLQKDGSSLYHTAIAKNDINLLKMLDGLNIDVNAKDAQGLTPLHKAAMMTYDDVILKYLINKGAKKNILTEFDESAFDLASQNEYLKEQKVNIDFLK